MNSKFFKTDIYLRQKLSFGIGRRKLFPEANFAGLGTWETQNLKIELLHEKRRKKILSRHSKK